MSKIKYSRLYADEAGESHLGEVEIELKSTLFAPPAPPSDISAPAPAARYLFAASPPGPSDDWIRVPCRQLVVILRGEIEVETSDGSVRRFRPGDIVLVEDTKSKGHLTRGVGAEDILLLFVQLPE
jgi:hypothetical protein